MSNRVALPRPTAWILLAFIYYLAAAASFSGFFIKWHFSEAEKYSLPQMLEGTAIRPFVYRQLLPMTANAIDSVIPQKSKTTFLNKLAEDPPVSNPIHRYFPSATDAANPQYALRYFLVYAMSFLSMFAAMFAIRGACIEVIGDRVAATLTPLAIAAVFPLILTEGGYYYDMPELMFMALGIWLAVKRRIVPLAIVTAIATLNKESYLLFVLTLVPFIALRHSRKQTFMLTGGLLALAAAVNLLIKFRYAGNGGGTMEYQLMSHIQYLINPRNYFRMEMNYGILTTKGFNVVHLLLVALLLKASWRGLPQVVRTHASIALVITVPLFIAFCYRDELRNLSLLTMTLAFVTCTTISTALQQAAARAQRQTAPLPAAQARMPASREPVAAHEVAPR
ncbi:hypothetical protein [Paraburkholderia fynbosensis]|uniref:Glycosyltransferase RgtA/B/C/D-like domain-containing protein n=1 Tax=Paraburkholderia fynbosensis TaxID=1200993 RepID=A0A6J5FRE0_9BURK|nr:hypothetical protein [Paraburkholderia fynbosensis]CAB3783125.1 hypothetical protein LMG27177_01430 [Paraburkholderia fynbosensis]